MSMGCRHDPVAPLVNCQAKLYKAGTVATRGGWLRPGSTGSHCMHKTLIVVDNAADVPDVDATEVITFEDYRHNYPKKGEPTTRIINLCDTQHYLSKGYYCSLLAEARRDEVLPSVKVINELSDIHRAESPVMLLGRDFDGLNPGPEPLGLLIYFGNVEDSRWQKLARKIFDRYPAPILKVLLWQDERGLCLQMERCSPSDLAEEERAGFYRHLGTFTRLVWRSQSGGRRQRWDMAILYNPQEKVPPSNREAINRFVAAAARCNIAAEVVMAQQLQQLSAYDALFIRETTAIDHYTYRLASRAEESGLVVIDDPSSILRCCNKVYLHDAFSYQGVPSLKTKVVSAADEQALEVIERAFDYPMVLKMPEGSFSRGVFKVTDRAALQQRLGELLSESALALVQEYLYTDFDWRIGVLNKRAIYACRYHMARNHWQIYNHGAKRHASGGFETLPTFEVPRAVLDAAVKAANVVGDGLYGVDLKQKGNAVYVIEVNDNPSIETKVEDAYLGTELYRLIMADFQRRLELGRSTR